MNIECSMDQQSYRSEMCCSLYCLLLFTVGMVKQPTNEASEFTMSSEDFPALPGTQNQEGPSPGGSVSGEKGLPGVIGSELSGLDSSVGRGTAVEKATKRGIQTSPDGKDITHFVVFE